MFNTHAVERALTSGFSLRLELILVLSLAALALTNNISSPPLVDWDEATYAEVAHEAIAGDHYLDLTWNGSPYLRKPPVLFWMVSASFKLLGESEAAARLPSVLMGLGTIVLLYASASLAAGRVAGFFAGLFPLGFYFFIARGGRECATDAPLIFFSTAALYGLLRARKNRAWLFIVGVSCGLAILSKGLAGAIPLITAALSIGFLPSFSLLGPSALLTILTCCSLVAAPWYLYQALSHYPIFFSTFVGHETVRRLTTRLEDDTVGANFSLTTFLSEVSYLWPLLLPLAGLIIARIKHPAGYRLGKASAAIELWLVWIGVALAAVCAVQTRLPWYILPALIPLALLAGTLVGLALRAGPLSSMPGVLAVAALVLIALTAPTRWRQIEFTAQSQRALSLPSYALAIRARAAHKPGVRGDLYYAGIPLPTLVYYSGMHCQFVETSELQHIDLAGLQAKPSRVHPHDLFLHDHGKDVRLVDNLDSEWHWSEPGELADFGSPLDSDDSAQAAD